MNEQTKNENKLKNKANSKKAKKGLDNLTFLDKTKIVIAFSIIFVLLFLIMYRNPKISESFAEINKIKNEISRVEKDNNQLEVEIQSSLNLYNVEQSAKDLLGMQKLTNSQTIYITLPKKDYIEASVEGVEIEKTSIFDKIKNKFIDIFR